MTPTSQLLSRLLALVLALLLPATGVAAGPADAAPVEPASVPEALESGDLTGAREVALEQREKTPDDPEAWRVEAEVHERSGDFEAAINAREGQLAALPEGDDRRATVEQRIVQLQEQSRGTVADEPPSTHREELDARRTPPAPVVKPAPVLAPAPDPRTDKVAGKWYFWVTMIAIVAAAGAITGIAIKAANNEQTDALDSQVAGGTPGPRGPSLFRF